MSAPNDAAWYVLRVTYNRSLKVKDYFDSKEIKNFIPMHYVVDAKNNGKRKLLPVIQNLIFVYAQRKLLDSIKQEPDLQRLIRYMMDKTTLKPIIVPDKPMQDFMCISGAYDEPIIYLDTSELLLKKGDKVRITKGIWEGVEGEFVRIKGDRRVVVSIRGVMAVATHFIHPSWIEPVK
jgi:transcription antitermination factor NusG